jgi:hypothetical protein
VGLKASQYLKAEGKIYVTAGKRIPAILIGAILLCYLMFSRMVCSILFTYIPCSLILSKSFYLPTDAQLNCLKNHFKIDIKTAPPYFGAITIIRERYIRSCLCSHTPELTTSMHFNRLF